MRDDFERQIFPASRKEVLLEHRNKNCEISNSIFHQDRAKYVDSVKPRVWNFYERNAFMRVEYVKNVDGSFKLDEDGKKIDTRVNNPFDFKTKLLGRVYKISGPPKDFPLVGKLSSLSLENLELLHKSNISTLVTTFVDDKICPDLISEDNLIAPFFKFFPDEKLFDFDTSQSTSKVTNLYNYFALNKVVCKKMTDHTTHFSRLVHNFRFFLIIFQLPDSDFDFSTDNLSPEFDREIKFTRTGRLSEFVKSQCYTTDQHYPKIFIGQDPSNTKEHICFHSPVDPEFLQKYLFLYETFEAWFLSKVNSIFDEHFESLKVFCESQNSLHFEGEKRDVIQFSQFFQKVFIEPNSQIFCDIHNFESCFCSNIAHFVVNSHNIPFTGFIFSDAQMVVSRLSLNSYQVNPKPDKTDFNAFQDLTSSSDHEVPKRDFLGRKVDGPKSFFRPASEFDVESELVQNLESSGFLRRDKLTGNLCKDGPVDVDEEIEEFSCSDEDEIEVKKDPDHIGGVLFRRDPDEKISVFGRFRWPKNNLVHHKDGLTGLAKDINSNFFAELFNWIDPQDGTVPSNGLKVCPLSGIVHVIFEGEYFKLPSESINYFTASGELRLPLLTAGLAEELVVISSSVEIKFCLDLMSKMEDFTKTNMSSLYKLTLQTFRDPSFKPQFGYYQTHFDFSVYLPQLFEKPEVFVYFTVKPSQNQIFATPQKFEPLLFDQFPTFVFCRFAEFLSGHGSASGPDPMTKSTSSKFCKHNIVISSILETFSVPFRLNPIMSDLGFEFVNGKFLGPHKVARQITPATPTHFKIFPVNMGKMFCDVQEFSELNRIRSVSELSIFDLLKFFQICRDFGTDSNSPERIFTNIFFANTNQIEPLILKIRNGEIFPMIFSQITNQSEISSSSTAITSEVMFVEQLRAFLILFVSNFSARLTIMARIKNRTRNPFGIIDPMFSPIPGFKYARPFEYMLQVQRSILVGRMNKPRYMVARWKEVQDLMKSVSILRVSDFRIFNSFNYACRFFRLKFPRRTF